MMNEKGGIIWTMRRSFLNHVSIDWDDDIRSGDVALAFMTKKRNRGGTKHNGDLI
ncbi:MAG: hypothetical protein ACI90V_011939 [Bacillariaceae sp.]|jgi:hypothetical protein